MKKFIPYLAFAAVALASLVAAGFAYQTGEEAARFKFQAIADDASGRLEARLDLYLALLVSTQAYFEAKAGNVTKAEFSNYYKSLDAEQNFPGLRGVGLATLARTGSEALLEKRLSADYGTPRAVYPTTVEDWRAAVTLFEPLDDNGRKAIGFDLYSEPLRRSAIDRSLETGQPSATTRIMIGEATGNSAPAPGVIVFSALRSWVGEVDSSAEGTVGLVYISFRAAELFYSVLARPPLLPVNVEVYDGVPSKDTLLLRSEAPPDAELSKDILETRTLTVGGRKWTLLFRPTSAFEPPASRVLPVLLGLAGVTLAGAIAAMARYQERALVAKSRLHEATEHSLAQKDLMLQEMKHRIKNSIARVLAMARQTAANSADIKEFSTSFAARLQAMASSQDMLTRSRWQKADLGDLLRMELEQVFGKEIPAGTLAGTKVLLDEATTQALGLTFHELATNALKYGAIGMAMSSLSVTWSVERDGAGRKLKLLWHEHGSVAKDATRPAGFGTKLINMNIERELRGKIERTFTDKGLSIAIDIPLSRELRNKK